MEDPLVQGFPAAPLGCVCIGFMSAQRHQSTFQSYKVTITPFKEDPRGEDQWAHGSLILVVVALTLGLAPLPQYSTSRLAASLPGPLAVLLRKER